MKKSLSLVLLSFVVVSCSRQPPTASAPVEPEAGASQRSAAQNNDLVSMAPTIQRESGVETMTLEKKTVPEIVRSTARLTNDENRTWRVGSVAEGRIVTVLANPGDFVKEDQVLARMHSHQIHEARADYQKALADLSRRKGLVDYAARVHDRAKRLYDLKAASLEQVERAEAELRNAETETANAQTEVERARSHITEVLGLAVDDASPGKPRSEEDDLIPVRSPASGVVLTRSITPGTVVTPSVDQFLISDLSRLWAIAEVNEEHLSKLRVGMPVRVYVQAYGMEPFVGRIGKIGDVLDAATRTVKVRVELTNSKGRLKPEMYANTEIEIGNSEPALTVPPEAVQEVRGQPSIFVKVAEDRFEVRPIKTGRAFEHDVEITGPVKAGDQVAVKAAFVLKSEFLKASLAAQ
jgi:cobalt-zinc-cadmium efflux system membrane fusion protein